MAEATDAGAVAGAAVSADSPPPEPHADLDQRVEQAQLRMSVAQILRVPLAYLLTDSIVAWLVGRTGLVIPALAWLLVATALQMWRWSIVRRAHHHPTDDMVPLARRMAKLFVTLGAWRAVLISLLFTQPIAVEHYFFTVIHLGVAASAIATVGGRHRTYAAWAFLVGTPLVLGWLLQGGIDGLLMSVLLVLLLMMLTANVRDQGQTLRQLVVLAHEKEQLAESLRHERDRAESANQSKTRFFAAASHDLRQPLHALSINATTLEVVARKQHDPMVRELSQAINRALTQSNSLLDGLLDISRLDAGTVSVDLVPLDAAALLRQLHDEFVPLAAQRGLAFELDLPPGGALTVASDTDQLTRVLNNLLSNSLKFTDKGRVSLSARDAGDAVLIVVADTGPGIAADEHERVFEEFYQVGNPSRDRSVGLGLGLAIVKRTAALLGIALELDSAPGRGTRFELRLPRAAAPPLRAVPQAGADDLPHGLRVLAIDDEPDILSSLRVMLAQSQCEVRCAAGSAEAAELLGDGFVPDVLLVDHRLRGETGPQAIERLRALLGVPVPAVIVTGDTAPRTIQQAEASGHLVLHKPVEGERLLRALAQVTRAAGRGSQAIAAGRAALSGAIEADVQRPAA